MHNYGTRRFFKCVHVQGCSSDTPSRHKNASDPVGIPLRHKVISLVMPRRVKTWEDGPLRFEEWVSTELHSHDCWAILAAASSNPDQLYNQKPMFSHDIIAYLKTAGQKKTRFGYKVSRERIILFIDFPISNSRYFW